MGLDIKKIGPGLPCTYCHQIRGQHLKDCPQIERDRERVRLLGKQFREAFDSGDDYILGQFLQKVFDL